MALQFPSSASIGQTYQSGSSPIYTYNGSVWTLSAGNVGISMLNAYTASLKQALQTTGSTTTMLGNLSVQGTQTALNQASLQISDKTIRIASGSLTSTQANGAGILIDGANVTMSWDSGNSLFNMGTQLSASKFYGDGSGLTGVTSYTNSDNLTYLNSKGVISGSSQVISILGPLNTYTGSNDNKWNTIQSVTSSLISATSSYETKGRSIVSGSSQLTSSYDGRYLLTGSVTSSINALNTATSSYETKGRSIVSGSSQLTSSYDSRYSLSGSILTSFSTSVDSRLDNQEAFSASLTTLTNKSTKILDAYYTGSNAWSSSYTGTGGTVKVEANFTIFYNTTGTRTFTLYRDGVAVDSGSFYFNQANTHTVMPTLYYIGSSEIGTHTYSVGHNATADINDTCNIVVTETFNSLNVEGSVNYVQKLGNRTTGVTSVGTIIISGSSITTSGNPVQIMVTGDANPIGGTAYARLQIYRDSNAIGNIIQVENNQNLNVPYCLNVIDTPPAGTYIYSMRTVSVVGGTLDFGEHNGPLLTAIELKTNTNLPSLNNTFTGTNTFNGVTKFGTVGGDEGGEIEFGVPTTNTTLSTRVVADVYRDKLRIFDGNTKGVYIDLSKAPTGVGGELAWKASGFVNAGTSVTLDDIQARVTTSGGRSLEVRTTGANFTAMASAHTTYNNGSYTYYSDKSFTMTTTFGYPGGQAWGFTGDGDLAVYYIRDTTNLRFWRMTLMIGGSYNNNFITIERLG